MPSSRSLVAAAGIAVSTLVLVPAAPSGLAVHSAQEPNAQAAAVAWTVSPTGSDDQFRGLSVLTRKVVWLSGESGTVLRTFDAGENWRDVSPPAAAGLALRDVEAFGGGHAVTLSIGTGEDSRIYSTDNRGRTWTEAFRNTDPAAFYDCMAFGRDGSGLALSDPVDGRFQLARTTDQGRSWSVTDDVDMPAALTGEFAFAASGTCIVASGNDNYWFATGGVEHPRIFRTTDGGDSWTVAETPLRGGPSAGIYSIAFRSPSQGVIVGGDFEAETDGSDAAAVTWDGGRTWWPSRSPVGGYRSGVDYRPGTEVVAVGPSGSDLSSDRGRTWTTFDDERYDSVQCVPLTCWASGTDGRAAWLGTTS